MTPPALLALWREYERSGMPVRQIHGQLERGLRERLAAHGPLRLEVA